MPGIFHRIKHKVFLLFLLLASNQVLAETSSSVWSVSKDGQQLYIGGTMHLLKRSDYPLPAPFELAYEKSGTLVFETDIDGVNSPGVQARLAAMLTLPPGTSLADTISKETYQHLAAHLRSTGLSMEQFVTMKPAMVALVITVVELQKQGLGEAGVDQYYHARGCNDGKKISWVESIDRHLEYIASMGEGDEDAFLKYSLLDLENIEPMMSEMIRVWREGDAKALDEQILQPMRSEFPKVYNSLIVERNDNWLPQIETMARTPEVEFILVGAGHLAGADGLLQKLAARGHKVEQLVAP
jgi:uncharacterized protein YbaP (TraB family)